VKLHRRQFLQLAAGAAALPMLSLAANAQTYPTRPMTMIIPFSPGGGQDMIGRVVAQRMSEVLGQQIVVENMGGAGGITASRRVADAPPDGYTMGIGSVGTHAHHATLYKKPRYNPTTDFAPVALLAETPVVLITRKDLPANSLPEFIAYARANQATMQFGSPGAGASSHIACIVLNHTIGVQTTHVPYRGGTPAMQDLVGGRIDYQCTEIVGAKSLIEGGSVRRS
jgi:tripartite-type tricarboxylate transporter receptor subunit TctC